MIIGDLFIVLMLMVKETRFDIGLGSSSWLAVLNLVVKSCGV